MTQLLFKNRWFAVIWVLATLASIASFVSEGGGQEKLQAAAEDFKAKSEGMQHPRSGHRLVIDGGEVDENGFTTDRQLRENTKMWRDADGVAPEQIGKHPELQPPDPTETD